MNFVRSFQVCTSQLDLFSYCLVYLQSVARLIFSLDNYIDGKEFTKLTEAEVKEMVTAIGIAKKIVRLIPKVCKLACRQ